MKKSGKALDKLLKTANIKKHDPDKLMVDSLKNIAKMSKIKYDELIKQGFTPDQAIELCKNLFSVNNQS